MLAVGVGRVWSRGWDIDPGDQGGIGGQRGLDLVQTGDPARPSSVRPERAWFGTHPGRCWPARAARFRSSNRFARSAWSSPLGVVSTSLSSRSSSGGQFAEAGSLGGCEPPVPAGSQFVEQAPAQIFLQRLPGIRRLTEPRQHGGQRRARWLLGAGGALKAGEGDPEPSRVQTLHPPPPLVARLAVFPLRVEVIGQAAVAVRGVRVFVGEQAEADRQPLLEKRPSFGISPLVMEVVRQVVVSSRTRGWSSVSRRR